MAKKTVFSCSTDTSKLPAHIVAMLQDTKAQKNKKKFHADLLFSLKNHKKSIASKKENYGKQYDKVVRENKSVTINGTPAGVYTNRADSDVKNELNTFAPKSLYNLSKNLIQRFKNFGAALASDLIRTNGIEKEETAVLQDFNTTFLPKFTTAMNEVFKAKTNAEFRYEDFIQYVPSREEQPDGTMSDAAHIFYKDSENNTLLDKEGNPVSTQLDAVMASVLAASVYEWLGTDSHVALQHNTRSKKQLLRLDSKATLSDIAATLLDEAGTHAPTLAEALGKKMVERLGISPTGEADSQAKQRMEMSLGFMALATLEKMGYVKRKQLYIGTYAEDFTGDRSVEHFGLAALSTGREFELTEEDIFYVEGGGKSKKIGRPTTTTISIESNEYSEDGDKVLPPELLRIAENMESAPDAFDKIFNSDPDGVTLSWAPRTAMKVMNLGRTAFKAGIQQTKNILKYSNTPLRQNKDTMDVFNAFDDDTLDRIIGIIDPDTKLTTRDNNVSGYNRSLRLGLKNVRSWKVLHDKREEGNLSTDFYSPSTFQKNMRMYQRAHISPQNSKMHRALFSPPGWTVSFNPTTDLEINDRFIEAIGFAFELESGKVGGAKKLREMTMEFLEQPEIQMAITALQEFSATKEMSDEQQDVIATAVEMTKNKTHGLKGLVEYARYDTHMRSPSAGNADFTTNIHKEVDGMSNGPIIGTAQLIPNSANKRTIVSTLFMGGFGFGSQTFNTDKLLAHPNLVDAYERMGMVWAEEVLKMQSDPESIEKKWRKSPGIGETIPVPVRLETLLHLQSILGSFTDEAGVVNKTIRSLSKPRTMQTIYGATLGKQINLLTAGDIVNDGIYDTIEDFVAELRKENPEADIQAKIGTFLAHVEHVTGSKLGSFSEYQNAFGKYTPDNLLGFKLHDYQITNMENLVKVTYGKSMDIAIEKTFSGVIEARKPLTKVIQVAVTTYNVLLEEKVRQLVEEHKRLDPTNKHPERITVAEMDAIVKSLEDVYPKIKTPATSEDGSGMLPLAAVDKKKARSGNKKIHERFDNSQKVKGTYAPKQIPIYKGNSLGIPYLKPPGVAPIVTVIQMLDAMVANAMMGADFDIVNNHDGFSHGIKDGVGVANVANSAFLDVIANYDLGMELFNAYDQSTKAARVHMKELGMDTSTLYASLFADNVITEEDIPSILTTDEEVTEFRQKVSGSVANSGTFKHAMSNALIGRVNRKIDSPVKQKMFVDELIMGYARAAEQIGRETRANKNEIMQHVTSMAQYPNNGVGIPVTPTAKGSILFPTKSSGIPDLDVNTIGHMDAAASQAKFDAMGRMLQDLNGEADTDNTFGSVSQDAASTNPDDYAPDTKRIDEANAVQVLDNLIIMDEENVVGTQDSTKHKAHLRNLLENLVGTVMNPLQLYLDQHSELGKETVGLYQSADKGKTGKVFIQRERMGQLQPGLLGHGLRLSSSEVYTHELVHHMTHAVLASNPKLRKQTNVVFEAARKAFEKRYGEEAYRVFLSDPTIDVLDQANEDLVAAAIARWVYVFEAKTQKDGTNNGLDEFVTFGTTNENFMRELSAVELTEEEVSRGPYGGLFTKSIQQTVMNIFNRIQSVLRERFSNSVVSRKADEQLNNLVVSMVKVNNAKKTGIYNHILNKEATLTAKAVALNDIVADKTKKATKTILDTTPVNKIRRIIREIPELDNLVSQQMRDIRHWYASKEYGLFQSVVTEVRGNTKRMQPLHTFMTKRKQVLDSAKQEAVQNMQNAITSWFKNDPSTEQKTALTKAGLRTDISSLLEHMSMVDIMTLLTNDQQREDRITDILDAVELDPQLKKFVHFLAKASDDLGYYMITSQRRFGGAPLMNAHNIGNMNGTIHSNSLTDSQRAQMVKYSEELSTLYSLRYASRQHKNTLADLIATETEAVEMTLQHHNTVKKLALKELFGGNPVLMQKGYTKGILNPRIQHKEGTLADREFYESNGYTMQERPLRRDPNDNIDEDIYFFKANVGSVNDWNSMAASMTNNSAMGTDPYQLELQIGNLDNAAKEAQRNSSNLQREFQNTLNSMFNAGPRPATKFGTNKHNYMIPQYNPLGQIIELRYMMSESTKDEVLEQFSEFDAVLPAMAGQIIDKRESPALNYELVEILKKMFDEGFEDNPSGFVEVSSTSESPEARMIYNMLPGKTKQAIESLWGYKAMYVPRDVMDIAFGQRKYSIVEMFEKNKDDRNKFESSMIAAMKLVLGFNNVFSKEQLASRRGRAINRAKTIEDFMTQLTSLVKDNIVVRSLVVTKGNYASNMAYLKSSGLTMAEIQTGTQDALDGALRYQEDNAKLGELQLKRAAVIAKDPNNTVAIRNYDRKIVYYENEIATNTSTALIKAGLMPAVVDDINTGSVQSPHKHNLDAAIEKTLNALPTKVASVGKTIFMTEDTEGYKMLNNAVKLTDYAARYTLYNHYVKNGMAHQEALDAVIEEFVNFDLPTHRMLEFANQIGLVWFSKYQLRILKQIKNLLTKHSFTTLSTFLLTAAVGSDHIVNSIPGVTKDMGQSVGDAFSAFPGSAKDIVLVNAVSTPFE